MRRSFMQSRAPFVRLSPNSSGARPRVGSSDSFEEQDVLYSTSGYDIVSRAGAGLTRSGLRSSVMDRRTWL